VLLKEEEEEVDDTAQRKSADFYTAKGVHKRDTGTDLLFGITPNERWFLIVAAVWE